jgi:CRISPR/Cas system-associated endoribonuclease Cas2
MEAQVARKYTDKANSMEVRMNRIFRVIRKSADSGLDFIILEHLENKCKETLIDLGYSIFEDLEGKTITIEW